VSDNGPVKVVLVALAVAIAAAAVFAGLYFTKTPTTRTVVVRTAPCGEQRLFGHIRSLVRKGDRYEMRFDPAVFTTGVTANTAAAEDGSIPAGQSVPNDNYVVDESHRTYLYLVPPSTPVHVLTPKSYLNGTPITVAQLAQLVAGKTPVKLFEPLDTGVWMRVHVDAACSIEQQYVP
jgi:hypothetical protein